MTISYLSSETGSEGGVGTFGSIPTGRPLDQTYLETATITIDPAALSDSSGLIYGAAAHEIGHSLGLQHNQYSSSVMYPHSQCITQNNQALPWWDTSLLEYVYDPYFAPKNPPRCTHNCGLGTLSFGRRLIGRTIKPSTVLAIAQPSNTLQWQQGQGYQGSGDSSGTSQRISRDSRNGSISVHFSDYSGSSSATFQSLYLSSSLVARVSILPGTSDSEKFPSRTAIRTGRITTIYHHLYGPDAHYHLGDIIKIVDRQPADTRVFADDPPLDERSDAIVFLSRVNRASSQYSTQALQAPTLPHVSKLGLDSKGVMDVAGSIDSEMAAQINSHHVSSLIDILIAGSSISRSAKDVASEQAVLTGLLRDRGIYSKHDVALYQHLMISTPSTVRRWALTLR